MNTYVLYHSDKDGQGAAYAAWTKLGSLSVDYISVNYNQPVPEMEDGSTVYIVDFSYSSDILRLLAGRMEKVVVIDHHKSVMTDLYDLQHDVTLNNLQIIFDENKAGCILAWEYFCPGLAVPSLLQHIADRDLWKFELVNTKAVHEALCSYPFGFELWDDARNVPERMFVEGRAILRANKKAIRDTCRNAFVIKMSGHKALAVNTSFKASEVCHYLLDMIKTDSKYKDCEFAVVYRDERTCAFGPDTVKDILSRKYDLRSEGDFDVGVVAQKLGGGGHKNSAGFYITVHKTPLG